MGAGDSYLAALIVSLLKKGWKKGIVLQADVIEAAMMMLHIIHQTTACERVALGLKIRLRNRNEIYYF